MQPNAEGVMKCNRECGNCGEQIADLLPFKKEDWGFLVGGCLLADGRRVGEECVMSTGYPEFSGVCRKYYLCDVWDHTVWI